MLPGDDGLTMLSKLRDDPVTEKIPVIIISAKTTELDRVKGLDLGADDYLCKSFGVMELVSRVKARLRGKQQSHAINMIEIAQGMEHNSQSFSDSAKDDFSTLFAALTEISGLTVRAFTDNNTELAMNVEPLEEVIDDLTKTIRDKHIDRLRRGECSPELGVYLSDLLINCERVSDHCSNIAVSIIQIAKSSMRSHVYLNELKAQRSKQFIGAYNSYHEKYRLSA